MGNDVLASGHGYPSCSCVVEPQPRLLLYACSDVEHKQMFDIHAMR